jgi:ubiquinone/menaquinone biosynthesis C-methylase UbiE
MQPEKPVYEAESIVGLEKLVARELQQLPGARLLPRAAARPGAIRFEHDGNERELDDLRLAQAVYRVLSFDVPRPKALLGHAYFKQICFAISGILASKLRGAFVTLGVDAAGAESAVMQRLKREISALVGLKPATEERGDLLIRIVPTQSHSGWECLIRLTPRPLATRTWRSQNFVAALNATVAQAMIQLTVPRVDDVCVNLCCGSGTLLVERMTISLSASVLIGIDIDKDTLHLARANMRQVETRFPCHLMIGDAQKCPLPDGCATALVADLPFGQRSGTHLNNFTLYPRVLEEAARIAEPGARFAILTHEIRLMHGVLSSQHGWAVVETLPIVLRGLHPRIYLLRRLP